MQESTSASNYVKSVTYQLVRLGNPAQSLHQLFRFDDNDDALAQGKPPFYCFQEKEEIMPDDGEKVELPNGRETTRARKPRTIVRWTVEDQIGRKGPGGLVYHSNLSVGASGSAHLLMIPNRTAHSNTGTQASEIFVVPVGDRVSLTRVSNSNDMPISIKEAEAMMKKGSTKGKGGRAKSEQAVEETEVRKLSRREVLERFLTRSMHDESIGAGRGGVNVSGAQGRGRGVGPRARAAREGSGGRGASASVPVLSTDGLHSGGDLAQDEESRELVGMGEEHEDEYEFQDDDEGEVKEDVNNARVGEESESSEEEEEEEDEESENGGEGVEQSQEQEGEESDSERVEQGTGLAPGTMERGRARDTVLGGHVRGGEESMQHAVRQVPAQSLHVGQPGVAGEKRKIEEAAGGQGGRQEKRLKLTFEANSLELAVRERLLGLGGRVKGKDLSKAVKDLLKHQRDVERVKFILGQISSVEVDPVDGGKVYIIKPEYAKAR